MNVAARIAGTAARHDREDSLVRSLLTSITVFRWLAWAWMAVLLVVNRSELREPEARPWLALALVGAALALIGTAVLIVPSAQAGDAWTMVQLRIKATYPGHTAPEWDAPFPVRQATQAMGGVHVLRMSENPMADRAHFIKLYSEYRKRADEVWLGEIREKATTLLGPPK